MISQMNSPSPPPGSALPQREQDCVKQGNTRLAVLYAQSMGLYLNFVLLFQGRLLQKTAGL